MADNFIIWLTLVAMLNCSCAQPSTNQIADLACRDVDRSLTAARKLALSPVISKHLNAPGVEILESFRVGEWNVIYVDTKQSDETFVFYSTDPLVKSYVTLWSGAARKDEGREIKEWTTKNAPGIPEQLANCFAWHVTNGRQAATVPK